MPAGGVLLTRVSTRSAVSRSVNWVATVARSASRRASRSLTFAFSALIWSNIVGVVVGMVAFSCFSSIGMINFAAKQATALVTDECNSPRLGGLPWHKVEVVARDRPVGIDSS